MGIVIVNRLHWSVMKIICAPDSFKESLSAAEAAESMAVGIRSVAMDVDIDLCPIADGGEGTVSALLAATKGQWQQAVVMNPLGEPIDARWGLLGQVRDEPVTAVIEMAAASGLELIEASRRDATRTSTYGTGQLISAALAAGASRIILGIGGSATNDGGCGAAQALGVKFHDHAGRQIMDPMTGAMLLDVSSIDATQLDHRMAGVQVVVACDVTNPMTGPGGAAHVYGPQKGADPQQVAQLDAGLRHLAVLFRDQLHQDVEKIAGSGAAGGMGAGLMVLLGGRLQPGVGIVLEAVKFEQRVAGCDLCLTGEGRIDGQSLSGKACLGVAQVARNQGVDTIALVGSVGPQAERTREAGLKDFVVIGDGLSVEQSMQRGAELVQRAAGRVVGEMMV